MLLSKVALIYMQKHGRLKNEATRVYWDFGIVCQLGSWNEDFTGP